MTPWRRTTSAARSMKRPTFGADVAYISQCFDNIPNSVAIEETGRLGNSLQQP